MPNGNVFRVSNLIAKTMTEFFVNKSPLYLSSNHDYQGMFDQKVYATGGSINVKIPGAPPVQRGLSVTANNVQDFVIPYVITEQDIYSVPYNLNDYQALFDIIQSDKALTTDQETAVVDNYGYQSYQAIATAIENEIAYRLATTTYLTPVDTLAKLAAVNNYNSISQCEKMATDLKLNENRYMMMNTKDANLVSNSLQNYFSQSYSFPILQKAAVLGKDKGRLAGFDVYRSTELRKHTAGSLGQAGTQLTVTSVSADGSSITFSGAVASTAVQIVAGDRISIPSVNLVDPIGHRDIDYLLVVTAAEDAQGDGAGNISVNISFPLMASGQHQNVNALPANGAAAFVFPDRYLNYAYTKAGISTVPLMLPEIYGAINNDSKKMNFPIRITLQGANMDSQNNYRIDTMVGIQCFAPYIVELPSAAS
jgi:P22 coat protein - gene protein 5